MFLLLINFFFVLFGVMFEIVFDFILINYFCLSFKAPTCEVKAQWTTTIKELLQAQFLNIKGKLSFHSYLIRMHVCLISYVNPLT